MITELMQYQRDFDWFLTGVNGEIIHLTSSGGRLPLSVKKSLEDLEFLLFYFKSLPFINEMKKYDKYGYESYASMSARGIFTYERADFSDGDGLIYKQVYIPDNCIFLKNQPREIQVILEDISTQFDPNSNDILDITKIGLDLE